MHFTHVDNLPRILADGCLRSDNAVGARLVTDVGARGIKEQRRRRMVPCPPGGVVADYVPFYYAERSPMMYRIACDHRDGAPGRYPGGDDPLVYLVSSVDRVAGAGLKWVASDGNCAVEITRFTNDPDELTTLIDWPLMGQRMWRNEPDDQDRMRRRTAELLVHQEFPVRLILGYVVRTSTRQQQVERILDAAGIANPYVNVRPSWYYGFTPGEVNQ